MCIIVAKEKGKSIPKKSILKACFDNNSDGAGFMYTSDNYVVIEKGFMNFDSLYKRIKQLNKEINLKKRSVVFHFRISTSGKVDGATCHPYPVTDKIEYLKSTRIKCKMGMAHNGIFSDYVLTGKDNTDNLNDSQNFVRTFIYSLYKLNKNFLNNEYGKLLVNNEKGYSRLCFLTADDELHYFGNWIEDNGIKYSNENYKPKETKVWSDWASKWRDKWYDSYNNYWSDYGYNSSYNKKEDTSEDDSCIYELCEDKVAFLNSSCIYQTYDDFEEFYSCDANMCIDEDYNLYKRISMKTKGNKFYYTLKLITENVYVYNKTDYTDITFDMIKKKGA